MRFSDHLGKGIWGAADKGLPVMYGVGFVVLVIRVLPEIEFGNFVLIQEIFLIISGLANAFALQPLLKYASEQRDDRAEIVGAALSLNAIFILVCSLLIVVLRNPLASLLNSPALATLLLYVPWMLVASFIRNFALVLLQTQFRMQQIFWTDAVHFIGAIVLVYVWSKLHAFDSAYDLILINLISLGSSSIVGLILCRNLLTFRWRPDMQYVRLLWKYGKFALGGILSYLFFSKSDSFFLAAFAGPAQVGVYNAVKVFVRVFDTMQQVIQMFLVPGASRLSSIGDARSLKVLTEKAICFGTIALLPILILFVFFAHPLLGLVYGSRFSQAAIMLQVFGLLSFITAANAVASNVLLGLGKAKEGFYISLVLLIGSAVFYSVCIPLWGALGATIGYLASSVLLTWLTLRMVQRFVPFTTKEVILRVKDVFQFAKELMRQR